jgi:hypothetical protein
MNRESFDLFLEETEMIILGLGEDEIVMLPDLDRETCLRLRSKLFPKYNVWTEPPINFLNTQTKNNYFYGTKYIFYLAKKD